MSDDMGPVEDGRSIVREGATGKARGQGKNVRNARTSNTTAGKPEISVALALLKYFYWMEIGIRSYLRSRDNMEFSRPEGLVIATVMLGYRRPSDIARQLGVSRQAVHTTLQQMKKKGIVDFAPDPDDGRIKQVVLTGMAQKMNADGVIAMDHLWRELGKRVGQADLNRLAKVLRADWGPPVIFGESDKVQDPWAR